MEILFLKEKCERATREKERSNQVYDTMELFCVYIHPEIDTLNQEIEHFLGLEKYPKSAVARKRAQD